MPVPEQRTCVFYTHISSMARYPPAVRTTRLLTFPLLYLRSIGVTHASLSNWEYMEVIRNAADPKCSNHLEKIIEMVDSLLQIPLMNGVVKNIFGLSNLEHDQDFVSVLSVCTSSSSIFEYRQLIPGGRMQ